MMIQLHVGGRSTDAVVHNAHTYGQDSVFAVRRKKSHAVLDASGNSLARSIPRRTDQEAGRDGGHVSADLSRRKQSVDAAQFP